VVVVVVAVEVVIMRLGVILFRDWELFLCFFK